MSTTKYAPVLAKIGAERSKLLSEAKVKGLSESKNIQETAVQLRDSAYQEQIGRIAPPLFGRKLERAFNENFIETLLKIIENSPKQASGFLELYLTAYEVAHIKALLNAINAKLTQEQRLSKIYFPVEDYFKRHVLIEETAKASTVNHAVHLFKDTEYFVPLSIALKNYEETGSTSSFDIYLDRHYYEKLNERFQKLSSKEKQRAKFYASMDNDVFVLLTVLRGKILNIDQNRLRIILPQNYFNLSKGDVEALVSAVDFEATMKIVLETSFGKYFVKAQDPYGTVANAEKAFSQAVLRHAQKNRILDTFNIGLPLAFLTMKRMEVHNLTAVSLGVEAAMKPEAIRSLLLF
jgi:V/A-type H+/Na+-transporting ATPase subunit C